MANYDIVLLDADETLFDFVRAAREALRQTLEKYGIHYNERIWPIYERHNDAVWSAFERGELSKSQLVKERFERLFRDLNVSADSEDFNRDYQEALSQGGYTLPGAVELCQMLSASRPLYIVTNGSLKVQRGRMEGSPLKPYIQKMFISDEIGFQKPRREFFDAVLSEIGVSDRSRVILLGDSLTSDMAGGRNAGIPTCWYNPNGKDAGEMPVDYEIRELSEFIPIALS